MKTLCPREATFNGHRRSLISGEWHHGLRERNNWEKLCELHLPAREEPALSDEGDWHQDEGIKVQMLARLQNKAEATGIA
jgi:hypothetical protein